MLFLSKIIAKLIKVTKYCITKQGPKLNIPTNNGSNNKQWINALERTAAGDTHIYIIIGFLLTCRCRSIIHISGPPSRKLALCTHRIFMGQRSLPCQLRSSWPRLPQKLHITCCSDCTTRTIHLSKPVKPSLPQNEVVLKLELCKELAWSDCGHILWLDTADPSDHDTVIALQALQAHLGQCPSPLTWSVVLRTQ